MRHRVEVLHGVNLNTLGSRNPLVYGDLTLAELEKRVTAFGDALGLEIECFQSNDEGEFVERLQSLRERADAAVINAGAWTHYSWAIRDALESADIPAVEVHISDISQREDWRRHSVFADLDLVFAQVYGKGPEGYREALDLIATRLGTVEDLL
jgi:3-dehydroquinate dehydratase II